MHHAVKCLIAVENIRKANPVLAYDFRKFTKVSVINLMI